MKNKKDYIGLRHGMLTVMQYDEDSKICKCLCECGAICYKTPHQLKSARSCGCLKRRNIAGNQFGSLTALRPTDKRYRGRDVIWVCRCEICGSEKEYPLSYLTSGDTTHCGCSPKQLSDEDRREKSEKMKKLFAHGTAITKLNTVSARKNNSSNFLGANYHRGKYRARITFQGRHYYIGEYDTAEEAHRAYLQKREELKNEFMNK